jgi:hypothetical protein
VNVRICRIQRTSAGDHRCRTERAILPINGQRN